MIAGNVYLAGFLKTSRPRLPSSGSQFFVQELFLREPTIKLRVQRLLFSPYPPFVLLANTFFFPSIASFSVISEAKNLPFGT